MRCLEVIAFEFASGISRSDAAKLLRRRRADRFLDSRHAIGAITVGLCSLGPLSRPRCRADASAIYRNNTTAIGKRAERSGAGLISP